MIPHPTNPEVDTKILNADVERLRRRVRILEERFQGYVYTETPAVIAITGVGDWVDLPYTGTLDDTSVGLEALTGKLGLKSVADKRYLVRIQSTFDAEALGPNQEMALRLVLNGTKIAGAQCHATGTANGVIAKLHSFAHFWMEPGDEVWMQASNQSAATNIGFERGKMDIFRLAGVN